ncbi:MAG: ATP-binding cassette domain-containing protein [Candidatus Paracaedibacteraceae bacterium]|nr:ATP-binding cassette domain-containing protein [Candidatus Paracaedibacteraceae bacterium]
MTQRRTPVEIVRFDHVSLCYPAGIPVFFNLNFSLYEGSFYFLTGASGAGKTSIMKLIYRDLRSSGGTITVFGHDISEINDTQLPKFRQKMGLVFQDCRLLPHLNALDNVALALRIAGMDLKRARAYSKELLHWVGLGDHFDFYPPTLSDGQKQRVGIARAVITRPLVLLADEPTGNVDDKSANKLILLLEELNKIGTTVMVATHNRMLVESFSHQELHLAKGELIVNNAQGNRNKSTYNIRPYSKAV